MPEDLPLLMDRAYEDTETRGLARSLGMVPFVPLKRNRRTPWMRDRELYKRRNEIERLFRSLKATAACSPASTNSMRCTLASCASHLSSRGSGSVNTP